MNHSFKDEHIGEFPTIFPDEPFEVSYEANQQEHLVVVQWMGEARGVTPAYYVFEGAEYTKKTEYPAIDPKEWVNLTDEQLQEMFPDEKELDPADATRVIEYIDGFGWNERGKSKTEHSEAIGKVIERSFGRDEESSI